MNGLVEIINIVSPVFMVIGIGYALGAFKFLSAPVNSRLSRLVFYVAGPALLFRSAAMTPIAESIDLKALGVTAGVSVVTALLVYVVAGRSSPSRRGVIAQGSNRSNMVFVGLPVLANAFGEGILGPTAILIGFMAPVYNFLAVVVLVLPHRHGPDSSGVWMKTLKQIATNPLIIACSLGLLFSGMDIGLPLPIDRTLKLVAGMAMPLALLVVGASLDFERLRTEIMPTSVVALIKLIIYPGLIYVFLRLMGSTGVALHFPVILMACPTAIVSQIMAREMKGDDQLAGSIVIGTTLASIITISAWLAFFQWTG